MDLGPVHLIQPWCLHISTNHYKVTFVFQAVDHAHQMALMLDNLKVVCLVRQEIHPAIVCDQIWKVLFTGNDLIPVCTLAEDISKCYNVFVEWFMGAQDSPLPGIARVKSISDHGF